MIFIPSTCIQKPGKYYGKPNDATLTASPHILEPPSDKRNVCPVARTTVSSPFNHFCLAVKIIMKGLGFLGKVYGTDRSPKKRKKGR
jgi:hypothetical protein